MVPTEENAEGLVKVMRDGKWGCIDKTGAEVIACQWDEINYVWHGLVYVKRNGKYGYVDKTGIEVIPCQWDEIEIQPCSMSIICRAKKNDIWVTMDINGNIQE